MYQKIIYIYRHGQTDLNKNKIIQGSGIDAGLNDFGRRQAQAFFERYRNEAFQLVITSALRRTHQTVQPFLEVGLPWEQFTEINEMGWGSQEGKRSSPEMKEQYRGIINRWKAGDYRARFQDGESASEMAARMIRFVEWLKLRREQKILICSHGRAMRCLMCILKGEPLYAMENYHNSNTGLYVTRYRPNRFLFERENDTEHLTELQTELL